MKQLAVALLLGGSTLSAFAANPTTYPEGFRNWNHIKSMTINKGHPLFDAVGGLHHIYANKKAMAGYKAGKFADGSVIVFDLFESVDKDNAVSEGVRKGVIVMEKNGRKFKETDGWGYQVFDAKTRNGTLDAKAAADCHACHQAQKEKDFVFSTLRD